MRNKRWYAKVVVLSIVVLIFLPLSQSIHVNNESYQKHQNIIRKAWLREENDLKILFINGSHYEMGYQQGFFLKDEINQNLRAFVGNSIERFNELIDIWNKMKDYVPIEYHEEIQGIADGSNLTFEQVIAGYMEFSRSGLGCFGLSVWGEATTNGRLMHTRSFDQSLGIRDPESGIAAYENKVLIVRKPDNGYASIAPSIAGIAHSGGGFNEMGIALGQQVCWSKDQTLFGTPSLFKTLIVLDRANDIDDALGILTTNLTIGWNYVVSDAKIPIGYAVELTGNHTYLGTWNDPVESIYPFWSIEDVVRRTNFFIEPTIASTQRERYNPAGVMSFIELVKRTDIFYAVWRSYKGISEDVEENWGLLNLDTSMDLIRQGYAGETDILLKIIVTLAEGTSFNRAWNMWVADPLSGDILVCFAEGNRIAYLNVVHHFNLFELLFEEPP